MVVSFNSSVLYSSPDLGVAHSIAPIAVPLTEIPGYNETLAALVQKSSFCSLPLKPKPYFQIHPRLNTNPGKYEKKIAHQ